MSKSILNVLCIQLFMIVIPARSFSQAETDKVISLEKKRFEAMMGKDTAFLYKVLSPELLYGHSSGKVDTQQSLVRSIGNEELIYKKMELLEIVPRSFDNAVILNGRMHLVIGSKQNQPDIDMNIRYLDVYRKVGKEWLLVAWQSTRLQ